MITQKQKEWRLEHREHKKEYDKKYRLEHKDNIKAYQQTPEYKAYHKAYRQSPECKALDKDYCQTPGYRARNKARKQTPDYKKYRYSYAKNLRQIVLDHYGAFCHCPGCDVTEPKFLAIDHINNDGSKRRKEQGAGGSFYRWIIRNSFPANLQVLCHNCNCAKGFYGECPHHTLIKK